MAGPYPTEPRQHESKSPITASIFLYWALRFHRAPNLQCPVNEDDFRSAFRTRSLLLDVESLRVFRKVVAHGGFSAASKTLGVTQPAVSLKIHRLEDRLGMESARSNCHRWCG